MLYLFVCSKNLISAERNFHIVYLKSHQDWNLPDASVTPETVYLGRRKLIKSAGYLGAGLTTGLSLGFSNLVFAKNYYFFAPRNHRYVAGREMTPEKIATTYTNFYEFGSSKNIWRKAKKLKTEPWKLVIDGLVESPIIIDTEDLLRQIGGLEERVYRHRCVEAWAMTVPWSGIPLSRLIDYARPLSSARYLRMETFFDPSVAPGQKQDWYPWPYAEGLTMSEANNELSFLATGIYGKPLPEQNGAPLRLVVPWKYGFKSIKSISRFTFTKKQPISFWEHLNSNEYGFWANVNPNVPHPRWSQAKERLVGSSEVVSTRIFNGYGSQVAYLYKDMFPNDDRRLFF